MPGCSHPLLQTEYQHPVTDNLALYAMLLQNMQPALLLTQHATPHTPHYTRRHRFYSAFFAKFPPCDQYPRS